MSHVPMFMNYTPSRKIDHPENSDVASALIKLSDTEHPLNVITVLDLQLRVKKFILNHYSEVKQRHLLYKNTQFLHIMLIPVRS
jgi:hypothetical protein